MKGTSPEVADNLHGKLSSIKKELKCWESLFFRSHGRKPNKEDIEESGNEIKGAYKQYYHLKEKLKQCNNTETEKSLENKNSCEFVKGSTDDGIFGKDLNKTEELKKPASHLKYHSVRDKHQTTFVKKRHLKAPSAVLKPKLNTECTNNDVKGESDFPVAKPNNNEETEKTNVVLMKEEQSTNDGDDVLKENKITGSLQIISKSFVASNYGRRTSFASKKTSAVRRNYHVSKEWLEKVKPKGEVEDELQPFEEFDQSMDTEFDNLEDAGDCMNLHEKESGQSRHGCDEVQMEDSLPKVHLSTLDENKNVETWKNQGKYELDADSSITNSRQLGSENECKASDLSISESNTAVNTKQTGKNSAVKFESESVSGSVGKGKVLEEESYSSPKDRGSNMGLDKLGHTKSLEQSSLAGGAQQEEILHDKKVTGASKVITRKRKAVDEPDLAEESLKEISGSKEKRVKIEAINDGVPKTTRGKRLVSENFVKIDIQKKKFCRGKRRIKASTYKRQMFKKKTQFNTKSPAVCFKCHQEGHWAKECGKRSTKGNQSRFSSFNGKTREDYTPVHEEDELETPATFSIQGVPDLPRCWPRVPYHPPRAAPPVPPLYEPVDGQPSQEAIREVNDALNAIGYSSFRPGQENTVARIVSGLSTLLVLSTGSGKSLCYQLPAYLFYKKSKSLTIVISPLVALMEDQVSNLPYGLKGACYHANMTKAQREKVLKDIQDKKIAILLLSPEALVSGSSSEGYTTLLGSMPQVAFACIDEAHCVSEWSHNFRPNYLRVCKVVRDYLGINCFLGLTATSTKATASSIAKHLGIELSELDAGIIRGPTMPDNLHITISKDFDRDQALVSLLSGERFSKCTSIIIYCTRREQTERLSSLLRTCLQSLPPTELDVDSEEEIQPKAKAKKKGKSGKKLKLRSVSWDADCYHAGMTPAQRRKVQKKFMSGELRIVVATTAFGMGLDKSDVRAIIHYNMPKSFEGFLQEIGRAGRDGLPAHCHIFLDEEAKDLCELRRHTYANSVDGNSVKKLVKRVFKKCDCKKRHKEALKHKIHEGGSVDSEQTGKMLSGDGEFMKNSEKTDAHTSDQQLLNDDFVDNCFKDDLDIDALTQEESSADCEHQISSAFNVGDVTHMSHKLSSESDVRSASNEAIRQLIPGDQSTNFLSHPIDDLPGTIGDQGASSTNQSQLISYHCNQEDQCEDNQEDQCEDNQEDQCEDNQEDKCEDNQEDQGRDNQERVCSGHHVTFSVQQSVLALDIPEENIATLLSYLEFLREPPVTLLNPIKSSCTLQCYGGARQMRLLAMKFLPVTAVFNNMRRNRLKLADSKALTFDVVEVADEMGWDLEPIYRELRSVQWNTSFSLSHNDSLVGKSGVLVEFDDPSFHVIAPGDLSDDEHDYVCSVLLKTVKEQEETRLLQLDALYNILDRSSNLTYHDVIEKHNPGADKQLRKSIREYFECEPTEMKSLLNRLSPHKIDIEVPQSKWDAIARDVRTMLCTNTDVMFTGRALARIFHGIDSPCFPATVWGRNRRFWRQYIDVDFNDLRKFITDEIIKYRT